MWDSAHRRRLLAASERTPAIAVTGLGGGADDASDRAGFDELRVKPVGVEELARAVARRVRRERPTSDAALRRATLAAVAFWRRPSGGQNGRAAIITGDGSLISTSAASG